MSWIDVLIVGVIAGSALISLYRGFIYEFVALATWVLAIWLAVTYGGHAASWLPESMDRLTLNIGESEVRLVNLRVGVAFVGVMVTVLILGAVANHLLDRYMLRRSLGLMDRVLGLGFGVLRGAAVVVILVVAAALTRFPETPWWTESRLIQPFESVAVWIIDRLPRRYGTYFSLGPERSVGM